MSITTATVKEKFGEKEYTFKPLTLVQVEELEHWMRSSFLRAVKGSGIHVEDLGEEVGKISFFNKTGAKYLSTITGVIKLFQATTEEAEDEVVVFRLMRDPRNHKVFQDIFKRLNTPDFPKGSSGNFRMGV